MGKRYVQISVYVSLSGGFTIRERGNNDLGYQLDKGGLQGLFQNGSGANLVSHTVGTVDSFPILIRQKRGSNDYDYCWGLEWVLLYRCICGTDSRDSRRSLEEFL